MVRKGTAIIAPMTSTDRKPPPAYSKTFLNEGGFGGPLLEDGAGFVGCALFGREFALTSDKFESDTVRLCDADPALEVALGVGSAWTELDGMSLSFVV